MRVGQISHVYPPHIGGIENYVFRLKQKLEVLGDNVTVYTTDLGLIDATNLNDKNIKYCKTDISILKNPVSHKFIKTIRESDDDIYHLHGYEFFTSLLAMNILKDKPKILTQHGTLNLKRNPISFLLNNPYRPFVKYILKNVDCLIVLGIYDKNYLINSYRMNPEKIKIIPNGLDLTRFICSKSDCHRFISKYNISESSFKIIYVGRLVRQKNIHKLIKAFKILNNTFNVELIIIGDGDANYVNYLNEMKVDCVHLLGRIPFGDELLAAYYVSDLFVLLSEHEGLPTAILEAMACGLPILTTPVGNIPEVVIEHKNGLFIDNDANETKLANMISYFISNGTKEMSRENINRIYTHYNWDKIAMEIRKLYFSILEDYY